MSIGARLHAENHAHSLHMAVSEATEDSPTIDSYLAHVQDLLGGLIPADQIRSNEVNLHSRRARQLAHLPLPEWLPDAIVLASDDHPVITSHFREPSCVRPRRVTDVLSQRCFEHTVTYNEVFRPRGIRFQLAILTGSAGASSGRVWILERAGEDFTDTELEIAVTLQPTMRLLDRIHLPPLLPCPGTPLGSPVWADRPPPTSLPLRSQPRGADQHLPYNLTRREAEVLEKMAAGWTAVRIAHHLRISVGTVRKHVEHIYNKLGCHDRLIAVNTATAYGLLDPAASHRR